MEWGDRACTGDVVARDESPLFFILVRSPDRLDVDRTNDEMSLGEFGWLESSKSITRMAGGRLRKRLNMMYSLPR